MTSPDPDRLRYAQIAGAVARHALGWRLTADEEAVAVAELTEAAAGRADLLAERAGTALGFGEGRPDAARYRQIAELCIAAGADPALIERWIKVGRERAATAAAIPYTGLPPDGLLLLARAWEPVPTVPARAPRPGPQEQTRGCPPPRTSRRRSTRPRSVPHSGPQRWAGRPGAAVPHLTQTWEPSDSPYRGNGARDRFTSMGRGSADG
jgi:hypothetical protein